MLPHRVCITYNIQMLTSAQLAQIKKRGLTLRDITHQATLIKKGSTPLKITAPATPNNGITILADVERAELLEKYTSNFQKKTYVKFVPASGAATRMFQTLLTVLQDPAAAEHTEIKPKITEFISRLCCYGFYPLLKNKDSLPAILKELLTEKSLDYARRPKGLVAFHRYSNEVRTAFTEHMIEALQLAPGPTCRVHFTILPEHLSLFKAELKKNALKLEKKFKKKLLVGFSFQAPHTDTIALDDHHDFFCDEKSLLLFRPSGHGALLSNLNNLKADIVLIKNIDNIAHDWRKALVIEYEKILLSYFCTLKQDITTVLTQAKRKKIDTELVRALFKKLNIKNSLPTITPAQIITLLDRPLRVCAMVQNEGEPGGGPFWVTLDGQKTLQILEKDQLNARQKEKYLPDVSHFNPVLMVCGLTNDLGKPYDLTKYIDENTCFVSQKSYQGRPLKALECPGLWNGAMAHWLTVFVEVPLETFTPVKTIFDLLRPEHQPEEGC